MSLPRSRPLNLGTLNLRELKLVRAPIIRRFAALDVVNIDSLQHQEGAHPAFQEAAQSEDNHLKSRTAASKLTFCVYVCLQDLADNAAADPSREGLKEAHARLEVTSGRRRMEGSTKGKRACYGTMTKTTLDLLAMMGASNLVMILYYSPVANAFADTTSMLVD